MLDGLNKQEYVCYGLFFKINYSVLTTKMISGADISSPSELATNDITWFKIPPYDVT